jgi:hypothetical protein
LALQTQGAREAEVRSEPRTSPTRSPHASS